MTLSPCHGAPRLASRVSCLCLSPFCVAGWGLGEAGAGRFKACVRQTKVKVSCVRGAKGGVVEVSPQEGRAARRGRWRGKER